jgi:hypothetical protein
MTLIGAKAVHEITRDNLARGEKELAAQGRLVFADRGDLRRADRKGDARHLRDTEQAILWGSLRHQRDCVIAVCGAEAGITPTGGILERIVQHRCSHGEEGLYRRPVPAHLPLLVHAFGPGSNQGHTELG